MRSDLLRAGSIALTVLTALPAGAHHSSAMYDEKQTITVNGVVTKYEWSNPHVYIYLEERKPGGAPVNWEIEGKPPSILHRLGWSRDTLHAGDSISVSGSPAKDASVKSMLPTSIKRGDTVLLDQAEAFKTYSSASPAQSGVKAQGLDGGWVTVLAPETLEALEEPEKLALTAAGSAAYKRFDEKTMHPGLNCIPFTAPIFMITPDLKRITVSQNVILIDGEFDGARRTVYMNDTTHQGAAPSIQGHSIGHWEGRTLVIDTVHFAPHVLGNGYGLPSGVGKHLVERMTPEADGTTLTYHFELTDPEFLAAPVIADLKWVFRPDLKYDPPKCSRENARRFAHPLRGGS